MKRNFRSWYCSACHVSHAFERIADVWVSRGSNCSRTLQTVSQQQVYLAYASERRLNLNLYS